MKAILNLKTKNKASLVLIISLLLTLIIFLVYIIDTNILRKNNIDDYILQTQNVSYKIEDIQTGTLSNYIQGYCYDYNTIYEYYNFGVNITDNSLYFNNNIALTNGEDVYIIPTTSILRIDLAQESGLDVNEYSFFAGVGSRFFNFFIPDGDYEIAFVYNDDNNEYIVLTDEIWSKS